MKSLVFLMLMGFLGSVQAQSSAQQEDDSQGTWDTVATEGVCSSGTPFQF